MASRKDIDFVDTFEYLGFHFKSGGDRWHHVEIRMAMVASALGWLGHIWRGSWLSQWLKLWIYNTYIVFVLTWGLPAWWLGDVERRKLRGWNARLLTWLLGTEHENFGEVVWQQTREPLFDLVAKLWVWWLRWLGHTLWLGEESMLWCVLTWGATPKVGSVLADEALLPHSSVEELVALVGNHVDTTNGRASREAVGCHLGGDVCGGRGQVGPRAAGEHGGGDGGGAGYDRWRPALVLHRRWLRWQRRWRSMGRIGLGRARAGCATTTPPVVRVEMWGLVVIDNDSIWFCEATWGI
jgi:hypothetical protein